MEQSFQYQNLSLFNSDPSFFETLNPPQNLSLETTASPAAVMNQALELGLSLGNLSLSSDHNNPGESGNHNELFDCDVLGNYLCQEGGLWINNNNDIGYLGLNPGSVFNRFNGGQRLELYDSNDMIQSRLWNTSALSMESSVSGTYHRVWNSNNRSRYDLDCLSQNSWVDFIPSDLHLYHQNLAPGNSYRGNIMMDNRIMMNGVSLDHIMVRTRILLTLHRDVVRVKNLEGLIRFISKDRQWCEILLEKMENMDNEDKRTIFSDIINHVGDLMMDPYGSNVVKKFVAVCSGQQRSRVLSVLTKKMFQLVNICSNKYGAEAVLKLLEHLISPQQRASLTLALSYGIYQLSKTQSGVDVITYCLKNFSDEENKFLFTALVENCCKIATDRNGCRNLQKYLDYGGQRRDRLVAEITANACSLAADNFGNYVVQYLLSKEKPQVTANILQQLEGHHLTLCWSKYGSNVVEACFKSGAEQFVKIVYELLKSPHFPELCCHEYGNFVVQAAMHFSKVYGKHDIHDLLLRIVLFNAPLMHRSRFGRKALSNISRGRLNISLSIA